MAFFLLDKHEKKKKVYFAKHFASLIMLPNYDNWYVSFLRALYILIESFSKTTLLKPNYVVNKIVFLAANAFTISTKDERGIFWDWVAITSPSYGF